MANVSPYQILNAAMLASAAGCPNLFIALTTVAAKLSLNPGPAEHAQTSYRLRCKTSLTNSLYDSSTGCIVEKEMQKLANQHAWLAEVLKDIDTYVRENQLWHMSMSVSQAYAAARTEFAIDTPTASNFVAFDHRAANSEDCKAPPLKHEDLRRLAELDATEHDGDGYHGQTVVACYRDDRDLDTAART